MNKDVIEQFKQMYDAVNLILADVNVLDDRMLLASKSATQAGRDRAVELYVQDAARFMAKWFPDTGIEITTESEAQAAHMILMRMTIDAYRADMGEMLDYMEKNN